MTLHCACYETANTTIQLKIISNSCVSGRNTRIYEYILLRVIYKHLFIATQPHSMLHQLAAKQKL